MIGYFNVVPKSRTALDAVTRHGSVMGVDQQKGNEVLVFCATPTCSCWSNPQRWRQWMRLHSDVTLGASVAMD